MDDYLSKTELISLKLYHNATFLQRKVQIDLNQMWTKKGDIDSSETPELSNQFYQANIHYVKGLIINMTSQVQHIHVNAPLRKKHCNMNMYITCVMVVASHCGIYSSLFAVVK